MQYQQDPMQQRHNPPPRGGPGMPPQDNQFRQQGQFGNQGDFGGPGYSHQGNMRQPGGGGYQDGYRMQSLQQPVNPGGDSQGFQPNSPRGDNRPGGNLPTYNQPQNSPSGQYQQQPRDQYNQPGGGFDYQGQPHHQGNQRTPEGIYYSNPNERAQAPPPTHTQKARQNVQSKPAPRKPREPEPITAAQLRMYRLINQKIFSVCILYM